MSSSSSSSCSTAELLVSSLWGEAALRVPGGLEEARLVLDRLTVALEEVLEVLAGVRGHGVATAEGLISAQLSGCL